MLPSVGAAPHTTAFTLPLAISVAACKLRNHRGNTWYKSNHKANIREVQGMTVSYFDCPYMQTNYKYIYIYILYIIIHAYI